MLKQYCRESLIPITKGAVLNGIIWTLITKKIIMFVYAFAGYFFGLNILVILLLLEKTRRNKEEES